MFEKTQVLKTGSRIELLNFRCSLTVKHREQNSHDAFHCRGIAIALE
jgi:hypothetical protein